MKNVATVIGAVAIISGLVFVMPLIALVGGAVVGWVAGLVFPETIALVSTTIFGSAIPAWQLGAGLAFVGSFFKTPNLNKK